MASARAGTSSCSAAVAIGLAGPIVWLPVCLCGTFHWWFFNDARGSICNGSGTFWWHQPPSFQGGRPAFFGVAGPTLSDPIGDAPASICEWTPMGTCTTQARLVRADKGIFCLCPIGPVGYCTVASECAGEGLKGPWGEGVVESLASSQSVSVVPSSSCALLLKGHKSN